MATVSFSSLLLTLALSSLLLSCSSQSTGCQSQAFSNNRSFSKCLDLPHLNSTLHWTFDSNTSNLTLAFSATPAKTGGWVAWGINPTVLKMLGTQALVAYADGGTVVVKTFDLNSFSSVMESKISYNVSGLTGEMSGGGKISIFATVTLPPSVTTINQVWQVGPGVDGGKLLPHAMETENMNSVGVLDLEGGGAPVSPPTGAPPPGTGGGVPVPPPVEASSPTPGGSGFPVPPPTGGGGVSPPPQAGAPPPGTGGGVPVPPPTGGGGVSPPPQAGAPPPGTGGGVPVPPPTGGGGVSPPPQAGAPPPISGNSGNEISNKNGSVILCLLFLLFSSI